MTARRDASRTRGRQAGQALEDSGLPGSWQDLPAAVRQGLEAEIQENRRAARAGELASMEVTEDFPAVSLAQGLKRALRNRGLTQRALAERLGVSPSFVSKVLNDPARSQLQTLRRFVGALDVELRDLL